MILMQCDQLCNGGVLSTTLDFDLK